MTGGSRRYSAEKESGVTTRSSVFHVLYLSAGSSVKGWHLSSASMAIFVSATASADREERTSGGDPSLPSRLKDTRSWTAVRSSMPYMPADREHALRRARKAAVSSCGS